MRKPSPAHAWPHSRTSSVPLHCRSSAKLVAIADRCLFQPVANHDPDEHMTQAPRKLSPLPPVGDCPNFRGHRPGTDAERWSAVVGENGDCPNFRVSENGTVPFPPLSLRTVPFPAQESKQARYRDCSSVDFGNLSSFCRAYGFCGSAKAYRRSNAPLPLSWKKVKGTGAYNG